ncbi:MAG: pilus assembly protein PilZ, partial [Hyphomicrobiales bacterium]
YNNRMSVNDCQVRDMSETGCKIKMDSLIGVPNYFTLHILNGDVKHECEVVWRKADMMGVKYL